MTALCQTIDDGITESLCERVSLSSGAAADLLPAHFS